MTKKGRKKLLNTLFLVTVIGVTLLILFLCNKELNFRNIGEFIASSNPWLLLAAFGCMILNTAFEGLSLFAILRAIKCKPKYRSSFAYASAEVYYSAITPSASGGQPASAFYMMKDGIDAGKSSFALVFNVIAYTAAFFVIGILAFALRPALFASFSWIVQLFIILGFVIQGVLLGFFIACAFWSHGVLKACRGIARILYRLHIIKDREKWFNKIAAEVEKYRLSLKEIGRHPFLMLVAFLLNVCQRMARLLVNCFVCFAADRGLDFTLLIALHAYILVGYVSIPLPGGTGAYEIVTHNVYTAGGIENKFALSAMMVSRAISYYLAIVFNGVYTLVYHVAVKRKTKEEGENAGEATGERVTIGENSAPERGPFGSATEETSSAEEIQKMGECEKDESDLQ